MLNKRLKIVQIRAERYPALTAFKIIFTTGLSLRASIPTAGDHNTPIPICESLISIIKTAPINIASKYMKNEVLWKKENNAEQLCPLWNRGL